jgi:uracil-DNA glycosylase
LVDRAGTAAFVTIHPSFLVAQREYRNFVRDLRRARKLVSTERSA